MQNGLLELTPYDHRNVDESMTERYKRVATNVRRRFSGNAEFVDSPEYFRFAWRDGDAAELQPCSSNGEPLASTQFVLQRSAK